ncbi:thiamine biosynthesis protein ThiI [Clostridium sulfidigenes]|uniref:Probable tRNA sulfurtransferase n=1 Tax=Clostridium sulfidigenes TaxID=318464 RepID=A0A084J7P4_9CLOT|nr:tRNA uracil 4-sulfurtransferase ThiI [Clostridium sulfidigenes]KEZ84978.1 thiamine biosynthesis protein ThiI [Clostridium sulfidigenes]
MRKLLLIKYASEIFLKGLNRRIFEKKLMKNIDSVLKGCSYEFISDQGRWFLYSEDLEEVMSKVKKVFGIYEVCLVTEVEPTMEAISAQAVVEAEDFGETTFKVESNRANKAFPLNSMEMSREIGAVVLNAVEGLRVDVHKPQRIINVEVRKRAYVYSKRVKAVGGMPYGTNGSTMLMLSGGIDSPVAGYLMARRGVELNAIYFHSHPYTSERAKEKVKDLARLLKGYTGKINLYVAPFTDIQMDIIEKCPENELTIIMRKFMMRVACAVAEKYNINSVTTGESIGQVASQTMEGLMVSNDVADRPVFRPLIAMDKIDIMDISRDIGTYETSILPYEDCCTIFVPKHPKIKPRVDLIRKSESILDIDRLVQECIDNMEIYNDL